MELLFSEAQAATNTKYYVAAVCDLKSEVPSMWKTHRCVKGCGSFEGLYKFPSGSMNKNTELNERGLIAHQTTQSRCLFSPLVESFESGKQRSPVAPFRNDSSFKGNAMGSMTMTKQVALSETATSSGSDYESRADSKDCELGNEAHCKPLDPVPGVPAENSYHVKALDKRREIDARRRAKAQPSSLSLSQGFSGSDASIFISTIGGVGPPVTRTGRIRGPIGVFMTLVVAVLAISTAAKKRFSSTRDLRQKICTKCDGYGIEICDICGGRGQIKWEGKLRHADPCPLCFGARTKKCSACGGIRVKKVKAQTDRNLPISLKNII